MNCDKCNQPVAKDNDAVTLSVLASELKPFGLLVMQARHLLPVDGCPGSPSRAQYLEGQPKDNRYPYLPEWESRWRAAYAELLKQ